MFYAEQINRIKKELIERKWDLEQELKTLPKGQLYITTDKKNTYYFERFKKTGNRKKERRVGISHDSERICALVRKKYIEEALDIIEKDVALLERTSARYVNADENSVMERFVEKYPELTSGIYYGTQSDGEWADDYDRKEGFYEENLIHTSLQGVMMRSKNELYIASRLDHYNIPYRYEAGIPHPDVDRVPDFTIRRPRDGKIIYWEHVGRTTDSGYMGGSELKFLEYLNADIVPWDNLIVSYDQSDGGVNAKLIDALIQGWLL